MSDTSEQILSTVLKIRELLELIAEPQVAARDQKHREELTRIVGRSSINQKCVFLMDGIRTQLEIRKATGADSGNLSTFVKKLHTAKLLIGDTKHPKLVISIPSNFFELKR